MREKMSDEMEESGTEGDAGVARAVSVVRVSAQCPPLRVRCLCPHVRHTPPPSCLYSIAAPWPAGGAVTLRSRSVESGSPSAWHRCCGIDVIAAKAP